MKKTYQYGEFRAEDEFAACRRLTCTVGKNQRVITIRKICPSGNGFLFEYYLETTTERK
jgi:hypothetical protein